MDLNLIGYVNHQSRLDANATRRTLPDGLRAEGEEHTRDLARLF